MKSDWLTSRWYRPSPLRWLLSPLSGLYRLITTLRRRAYQTGIFASQSLSVPVIIVGNISVGGSGKTPVVLWLAEKLKQQGFKPGIISRGYGGNAKHYPLTVTATTPTSESGDEPKLLAMRSGCPVVVAPDRIAAGQQLLAEYDCDIIISDDGLQHYRLNRDIELVVVDSRRGFGNGFCLPAGPLREPISRLNYVDYVIWHGANDKPWSMHLAIGNAINLATDTRRPLNDFRDQTVHAVAGIGDPSRFFTQLRQLGLTLIEHPFPDHHDYLVEDLQFNDDLPILMTEKDAVKCAKFANENYWSVPAEAILPEALAETIASRLKEQ